MHNTITISAFNTVWTITLRNKSMQNGPTVWVCQSRAAYDKALADLANMPHMEVIDSGAAHVVTDEEPARFCIAAE
jgi:hypothetical protein